MPKSVFALLLALATLSFYHPTTGGVYLSIRGSKQGQFKGQIAGKGGRELEGWFRVESFNDGGDHPQESMRPDASGKRQHKSFVIVKELDGASPKLAMARQQNESLDNVAIQTLNDRREVAQTITLTNARIVNIKTNRGFETVTFEYGGLMEK